jgi:hypothetical protein
LHLQVRQLHWAQLINPPPHPQSFPTVPYVVTCELPHLSHVCSTRMGLIIFFVLLFSSLVLLFVRVHNQLRCASIRGIRGWLKSNRLNDVHAEFRTRSHRTPIPCVRNLCFLLLYWTEFCQVKPASVHHILRLGNIFLSCFIQWATFIFVIVSSRTFRRITFT